MTTLRTSALLTLLVIATAGWAAPPEPAGVKGYFTWTDPDKKSQKHLVMGLDPRTGTWVFAEEFPLIYIKFNGGTSTYSGKGGNVVRMSSPSVLAPVDATGRVLPGGRVNWVGSNIPVAFRYSVAFLQDPGWKSDPVILPDNRTIKYNPTQHQFLEVVVQLPWDDVAVRAGGVPNQGILCRTGARIPAEDFLEKPPTYKPRKTPFTDLPNF